MKKPCPHFNAFYCDNAILIQFILNEFIQTGLLSNQIYFLFEQHFHSEKDVTDFLTPLRNCFIELLAGDNFNEIRPMGALTKLKHYCFEFLLNANSQSKYESALYDRVCAAWLSGQRVLEALKTFQKNLIEEDKDQALLNLAKSISQFQNKLKQLPRQIPDILRTFHRNENVMFFVMQKEDQLKALYGSSLIPKIFKTSSYKEKIMTLIIKNYTNRGFEYLFSRSPSLV